jgi:hypothetical protein
MNTTTPIEALIAKAEEYGTTTIELFMLRSILKSTDILTNIAERLVLGVVVILFAFMVNIGIALWIGQLLGAAFYGFFVVAGCYALMAVLLHYFHHSWIAIPLSNVVITQILNAKNEKTQ